MKEFLKTFLRWVGLLFAVLVTSLLIHNQYSMEQYIQSNKSRYSFLDDRVRKSYIPFTAYDIWSIVSTEKKKRELMLCDELFKKYGYPITWSPNKDTYLISIYLSSKEKNELVKEVEYSH